MCSCMCLSACVLRIHLSAHPDTQQHESPSLGSTVLFTRASPSLYPTQPSAPPSKCRPKKRSKECFAPRRHTARSCCGCCHPGCERHQGFATRACVAHLVSTPRRPGHDSSKLPGSLCTDTLRRCSGAAGELQTNWWVDGRIPFRRDTVEKRRGHQLE